MTLSMSTSRSSCTILLFKTPEPNVVKHDDFLEFLNFFGDFVFTIEGIFHIVCVCLYIYMVG
jgi:hypothetical protein